MPAVLDAPLTQEDIDALGPEERQTYEEQNYKRPPIQAGAFIQWFREGDTSALGYRALVLDAGDRALKIQVFNLDVSGVIQTSVRHIHDPEIKRRKNLARNHGLWDYTPEHKQLDQLMKAFADAEVKFSQANVIAEKLAALSRRVEKLESELGVDQPKKGKG